MLSRVCSKYEFRNRLSTDFNQGMTSLLIGEDGNRDALPTTLIESLAMGLPCISTPVVGIPEILDQGRAGVMVPENDDQATADAIGALLADPARRAELAKPTPMHTRTHIVTIAHSP